MRDLDSPKAKAMLDLAAPLTVGEPASEYFEKLGSDLVHMHLVDCVKDKEDHLIAGDGELPFEEVLMMLDRYGYDGYCSIELFDEYRTDPILTTIARFGRFGKLCKTPDCGKAEKWSRYTALQCTKGRIQAASKETEGGEQDR
jgi:hypothetical protein